ncbi:MAG: hypothetical protein IBX69_17605 [Anaerolineales bacterium]|nr:hypothetical protein [Anaerolineales bacterium]
MSAEPIGYGEFVRLVIEALETPRVEYLIGGAVTAWAWGEPRSTLDLDLVVDIPLEAVVPLSTELEKWDMLVPPPILSWKTCLKPAPTCQSTPFICTAASGLFCIPYVQVTSCGSLL